MSTAPISPEVSNVRKEPPGRESRNSVAELEARFVELAQIEKLVRAHLEGLGYGR